MKQWWFKFETGKWRNDSSLRRCSLETKGFWIECVAAMREAVIFELSGTIEEVARLVGCFPEEAMRCLVELKRTETADVTLGHGTVTVKSRYIERESKVKEQNRLRKEKERRHANVTPPVTVQSKSKSKNKNKTKKEKAAETGGAAAIVFGHWQEVCGHPHARFTDERRKLIERRLGEGYSVDFLKQAIDGNKLSPHHQGANDTKTVYDDLELILRNDAHVERFASFVDRATSNGNGGKPPEYVVCDECREMDGLKVIVEDGQRVTVRCRHGQK